MTEADSNKYLDSKRCVVHTVYEMRLRAVVLRSYRVGWCQERDDDLAYPLELRLSTAPTGRNPWEVDDS